MSMPQNKEFSIDDIMGKFYNIQNSANRLLENVISTLTQQVTLLARTNDARNEEFRIMWEKHPDWKELHQKEHKEEIEKNKKKTPPTPKTE